MNISLTKSQRNIIINLLEHDNEHYEICRDNSEDNKSKEYYQTLINENNEILRKLNAYIK